MKHLLRLLTLVLTISVIGGCSFFGGKEKELPPTELMKFSATLDVERIWSTSVGKGSELLRLGLSPAGDGARIYAASHDGKVSAYDPESGRRQWRVEVGVELSSGPGVGHGLVVVSGRDGDLICLDAADGREIWRINIIGESLARPIVDEQNVIAFTIDGRLRAVSAFDGQERWVVEQALPLLTLRGSASPVLVGSNVVSGFDNGRLIATNIAEGVTEWEVMLSPPSGRTDLDRLADVDGSIAVVGQDLYASGYHGRVASLAAESGQILWAREISTYAGIGVDWNNVYVVGEDGEVIALLRRNGGDVWRQAALIRREPTAPVPFHTAVVVGDMDGYVHFFNNEDGMPAARVRVGKGMISDAPVVIGGRLYVQSEDGTLTAFEVPLPEPVEEEPDVASETT
jgi:outer membrane protein assembly factor BamB